MISLNKRGRDGGLISFLAVLGVIFLLWLGFSFGKYLCEEGFICETGGNESSDGGLTAKNFSVPEEKTTNVSDQGLYTLDG
jgi:hypothetical protein